MSDEQVQQEPVTVPVEGQPATEAQPVEVHVEEAPAAPADALEPEEQL